MSHRKEIKKLKAKQEELNNPELIEKQHRKGKLTARERIDLLTDQGTFLEMDPFVETRFNVFDLNEKKFPGDSVITGFAKINDRPVYIYSQDFSKMGGSLGEMHGQKMTKVIEMARKTGCPCLGIIDSGGARIQEGISGLDGYASIFRSMIRASGVIPQITIIAGPSAGGASYAPGLSDFVLMVEGVSEMYITGPEVIKKITGEKVSSGELGGAGVHGSKSGCAHFIFESEKNCFAGAKKILSYLPQNNLEDPPKQKSLLSEIFEKESPDLLKIIPENEKKSYDMRDVIGEIFDRGSFLEVQPGFAINSVVGFCRLEGNVIGIVANQPKLMAGTLDIDSSDKIARFVRFCDSFNIPLINLVDTPGYLPGTDQEHRGIIRHGAKVLYSFAEATVPKISLILRKSFGGAYIALSSRKLGQDMVLAWPFSQISVMGPEQAVRIIYRKEIAESKNPAKTEKEKIEGLRSFFMNPYQAAKLGQVDMVIHPKDTRTALAKCLESLLNKRENKIAKKHGNMPL